MKRSLGRHLTILTGLVAVALAGSTLAQPKLDVPAVRPPVKRAPTLKQQPPGKGAYVSSTEVRAITADGQTDIASLSVPPGNYLLLAKAVVVNDAASPAAVACGLHDGKYAPAAGRDGIDYASVPLAGRSRSALPLTGTHSNPGPVHRALRVSCQSSSGSRLTARWIKLTALAVDAVESTPARKPGTKRRSRSVPKPRGR